MPIVIIITPYYYYLTWLIHKTNSEISVWAVLRLYDWSVVIISEISLDDTEISFKHEPYMRCNLKCREISSDKNNLTTLTYIMNLLIFL